MPKTEIMPTEQVRLAKQINDEHRKAGTDAQSAAEHAVHCGELLVKAKRSVGHGNWADWVLANCEFNIKTAERYIMVARSFPKLPNSTRVSNLSFRGLLGVITEHQRAAKETEREKRRKKNREKVADTQTLDTALDAVFATLVVDPPWDHGDEGDVDQLGRGRPTYATMSYEEIAALPIGDYADVDAHLYLWITNRSLPKGFGLLEAWGFRYVTCLTWVKPSFGMGNYFRGQTEQVLFGVKGSQPLKRKDVGTCFSAPRGDAGHSSKPDEFYKLVESCSPSPYLDVFSREQRSGWVSWGADAD